MKEVASWRQLATLSRVKRVVLVGWLGFVVSYSGAVYASPSSELLGAERCGTCHEVEYAQWKKTGHAEALARLSDVQAKTAVCRSCHTMNPEATDPALAGVQCESCHGAGRFYAARHVMKDPELRTLLGLTPIEPAICKGCHESDTPGLTPFDFERMVARVRHRPSGTQENAQAPAEASPPSRLAHASEMKEGSR